MILVLHNADYMGAFAALVAGTQSLRDVNGLEFGA